MLKLGTPTMLWEPIINLPTNEEAISKTNRTQVQLDVENHNAEISVHFYSANNQQHKLKMRMNMPFSKAMDLYCKKMNVSKRLLRFLCRERIIDGDATPADLSMVPSKGGVIIVTAWNWLILNIRQRKGKLRKIRVLANAPLGRVLHGVCNSLRYSVEIVRFMIGNHCIQANETPNNLNMQDGDEIVFAESDKVNLNIYLGTPSHMRSFLIVKTDMLYDILQMFCMQVGIHPNLTHFWYRGVLIGQSDTAGSLGMKFNNYIVATSQAAVGA